ncbi:hypothetical protein B834_1619 [Enterococcus mundtii 1A]|uniref:hypothetical protein n=1 Tax=Enterococcus mundtii TaxID=53346 RepID=UPI0023024299|nr:hypothetical protein [Enterococcus mundtii]MDA9429131.1 hypothetical protein [Enterococcus mundtii 1A]
MVATVKVLGLKFDGYGTFGEWVGIILIMLTIWQTSKYYWYSNRSKIVSRITEGVTEKSENINVVKCGFTISLLNEGKSETAIKFCGLIDKYNICQRFIRKHWYKYIYKYPILKRLVQKCAEHEIFSIDLTDFLNQEYNNIGYLEKGLKIQITNEELVNAMVKCINKSKKLKKRCEKCKKLKFSFLFLEYNGKEYYQDIYVTREAVIYKEIEKKITR